MANALPINNSEMQDKSATDLLVGFVNCHVSASLVDHCTKKCEEDLTKRFGGSTFVSVDESAEAKLRSSFMDMSGSIFRAAGTTARLLLFPTNAVVEASFLSCTVLSLIAVEGIRKEILGTFIEAASFSPHLPLVVIAAICTCITRIGFQMISLATQKMRGCAFREGMQDLILSSSLNSGRSQQVSSKGLKGLLLLTVLLGVSLQSAVAASFNVDLTTFVPGAGARFYGESSSYIGRAVVQIGDHNKDGFDDYMLASADRDFFAVIVMKKNTSNVDLKVTNIVSNEYFRVIKGPADSKFGSSLGGIGDINGDGFDDVLIGATWGQVPGRVGTGDGSAGFAVVIFGAEGPFTDVTITVPWAPTSVGFMILGPSVGNVFVSRARSARGLGDVNGDGYDDFAVSSVIYQTNGKPYSGTVWLIFGKSSFDTIDTLAANFGSNGIRYNGANAGDFFGLAVMPAGDFNGDGIADFLIGANGFDFSTGGSTRTDAGGAFLVHGSKTALVTTEMSTFTTGSKGVRFLGGFSGDRMASVLGGIGDINGDGIDDIAIGSSEFSYSGRSNSGVVYVIYGTTVVFPSDIDLRGFAATTLGFAIYGSAQSTSLCTAAPAGDVNGDGVDDLLVGGTGQNSRVHIVYGQTAPRTNDVDTALDDVMTFYYNDGAFLGGGLDGGRDLNGDGISDILLGAYSAQVTPADGGASLTNAGAVWMMSGPFIMPAAPTVEPSLLPSVSPSADPTVQPSKVPSADPSTAPSLSPSTLPTLDPTVEPTSAPTFEPSLSPTVTPSAEPTLLPTAAPTMSPTLTPTAAPTLQPTLNPSVGPTLTPTTEPTLQPSLRPSVSPSVNPTASPFLAPTATPSSLPTARPTVSALANYELTVNVDQVVFSVNTTNYNAQQAAYNNTIQNTVADAVDGVVPDRVTDIVVEEEEEEGGRLGSRTRVIVKAAEPVRLKYKITTNDPLLTVAKLRAQLVQAAQEGKMDRDLRYYAAQFGATGLNNGTFGEPQVTSAAVQRDASEQLTGVQIALVVIGVVVGLGLLAMLVLYPLYLMRGQPSPAGPNNEQLDMVM